MHDSREGKKKKNTEAVTASVLVGNMLLIQQHIDSLAYFDSLVELQENILPKPSQPCSPRRILNKDPEIPVNQVFFHHVLEESEQISCHREDNKAKRETELLD